MYKIKFRHFVNSESSIEPKEEVVIFESEFKEETKQFFKELKRMYMVTSLGFTETETSLKFLMNYRNEEYYLNLCYDE